MTNASQQIVTSYDVLGMTPEQISLPEDQGGFGYDIVSVKATLMQYSGKYRVAMQEEPSLDYDTDEQMEAKRAILGIMRNTEDDHLKAKLALKIRDDGKGRLDIVSNVLKGGKIDIQIFNVRLLEARAAKARSKEVIDISTMPSKQLADKAA